MLNAKPHLNGNTVGDFKIAWGSLDSARTHVLDALRMVNQNVVHGRNYQHLAGPAAGAAQAADRAVVRDQLVDAANMLDSLSDALKDAIVAHEVAQEEVQ